MTNDAAHGPAALRCVLMSTTTRKAPSTYEIRQQRIEHLAAHLTDGEANLMQHCRSAAAAFHEGVMASDPRAVDEASIQFEAGIIRMNGGSRIGCRATEDAPSCRVARTLATIPGKAPSWGQPGRFEIEADGMRAVVDYAPPLTDFSFHLQFHAVDECKPFISETGYRSHYFQNAAGGSTVAEFAVMMLKAFRREGSRMIEAKYRERVRSNSGLPWLACIEDKGPVMDDLGQLGFAF